MVFLIVVILMVVMGDQLIIVFERIVVTQSSQIHGSKTCV